MYIGGCRVEENKIPVGISSCLLGEEVRFNGGHKQSRFCLDHLSRVFEFQGFCPEVAIGMGVPREPIRLVGSIDAPRAVGTVDASVDVTDALAAYGDEIGKLSHSLCGYILMKNSPSCGLYSAKVYTPKGGVLPGKHAGIFARALRAVNPLLPLEEEGRLNDALLRENFIARVFAYSDWRSSVGEQPTANKIVKFHSRYKYMLMAHGQKPYRELGQMVAGAGTAQIDSFAATYIAAFMAAITKPASRKGHSNTLYHMLGYLREEVPGEARQALAASIEEYRKGIVNLAVPVALLKHYLKMHGSDYIKAQAYLEPYANDLGLRNQI